VYARLDDMEWMMGGGWRGEADVVHLTGQSQVPILLPAMPLLLPVPFSAIAKSPLALDCLSLLLSSVEFGPLPGPASHLRRC